MNTIARSLMGFVQANRVGKPSKSYRFACVPFVGSTSWHATQEQAIKALVALDPGSLVTYAPPSPRAKV